MVHSFWFRICMRLLPFLTMSSWNHWYWYQPMIPPGPWSTAQWRCYVKERLHFNDDEMNCFDAHLCYKRLLLCQWWQAWSDEEWKHHIEQWSQKQWDKWRQSVKRKSNSSRPSKWRHIEQWSQKQWDKWRQSVKRKSNSSRPSKWRSFFSCLRPSWRTP